MAYFLLIVYGKSKCHKTKKIIKNVQPIFKKLFGIDFKLNVYRIVFGTSYKFGNNVTKLRIFLRSKVIKRIWICRKLLEKCKPCNEMAIFKTFVKNRLENEYHAAFEQQEKRNVLTLLVP